MMGVWEGFRNLFVEGLSLLHGLFRFVGDDPAWGFAIMGLTIVVRVLLLPLAIKQTRSMRAMQELSPQIKALQKKYKVDRELMRKDPERYRRQRQKMGEEMSALYKQSGVNPAMGCLPLIAQAPVFIALFQILNPRGDTPPPAGSTLDRLLHSDFYFFTPNCTGTEALGECGLSTGASVAGWPGYLLIVVMAGSMFYAQRQMMARSTVVDPAQLQQQRIIMYVMPVFLAAISFMFPIGVLLYWVTTNLWQIAQQAIVLRDVSRRADKQEDDIGPTTPGGVRGGSHKPRTDTPPPNDRRGGKRSGGSRSSGSRNSRDAKPPRPSPDTPRRNQDRKPPRDSGHLPSREDR